MSKIGRWKLFSHIISIIVGRISKMVIIKLSYINFCPKDSLFWKGPKLATFVRATLPVCWENYAIRSPTLQKVGSTRTEPTCFYFLINTIIYKR